MDIRIRLGMDEKLCCSSKLAIVFSSLRFRVPSPRKMARLSDPDMISLLLELDDCWLPPPGEYLLFQPFVYLSIGITVVRSCCV